MSHCFERRFGREIEDLSQENKIQVSYKISDKEQKLYREYDKVIAKLVIFMDGYDIVLYMPESYPFRAPQIVIRLEKHSKEFMHEWNENMKESILEYIGDDDYEYFTIQAFTCYHMDFFCRNQEEKEIFLKWKYNFDTLWFNRSKYAASSRLREIIPDVLQLMYLIRIQKERFLIPQV
jgi:hypothetical protein